MTPWRFYIKTSIIFKLFIRCIFRKKKWKFIILITFNIKSYTFAAIVAQAKMCCCCYCCCLGIILRSIIQESFHGFYHYSNLTFFTFNSVFAVACIGIILFLVENYVKLLCALRYTIPVLSIRKRLWLQYYVFRVTFTCAVFSVTIVPTWCGARIGQKIVGGHT